MQSGPGTVYTAHTNRVMTPICHLRYYMVGLLFFASVISYVDRQTLSVNAPYIREDLGLSNTEYGYLVNAFLVAYTIGPIITGRLVDRMGSGLGLSLFIGWWSIAGMMHAATRGLRSARSRSAFSPAGRPSAR